MADWKQITARIRRARTSKDPAGQLAALYEKTHDAMVAFELAKYFESESNNPDASKWYGTAAERFRRADWKTKALEAAVRLGGDASAGSSESASGNNEVPAPSAELPAVLVMPEPSSASEENVATFAVPANPPNAPTRKKMRTIPSGTERLPRKAAKTKKRKLQGRNPKTSAGAVVGVAVDAIDGSRASARNLWSRPRRAPLLRRLPLAGAVLPCQLPRWWIVQPRMSRFRFGDRYRLCRLSLRPRALARILGDAMAIQVYLRVCLRWRCSSGAC